MRHPSPPAASAATGMFRLALDSGQTSTKALVLVPDGSVEQLSLPGVATGRPLLPQLASITRQGVDQVPGPVEAVAIGCSGLTPAETRAEDLHQQVADTGLGALYLTHDSVTSYLGALGTAAGAVVASGTGVVTLAVGHDAVARVDGWGHIMGDAGSGYWFGREVLQAVMRAYDRRGPQTALTGVVTQRWPELESAYIDLQNDENAVSVVASFARAAAEYADDDDVAHQICLRGAAQLADSVVTALQRVGQDSAESAPEIAAIGGVFGSELIAAEVERVVTEAVPGARMSRQGGHGADGAAALLSLDSAHPLFHLVSSAGGTP